MCVLQAPFSFRIHQHVEGGWLFGHIFGLHVGAGSQVAASTEPKENFIDGLNRRLGEEIVNG